jgi:hypothetical protein
MKYTSIQHLQEALKQERYRHAGEEQDQFEVLLESAGSFRSEFLRWVFEKYAGFVDTRKQAGLCYFQENRDEALSIIQKLIHSEDPDDRDTANEVLQQIKIPQSYGLVKILLDDKYPYLQFDACEFLREKYPADVKKTLLKLLNHEIINVRETANKLLQEFRVSN